MSEVGRNEQTLFPHRDVTLASGKHVVVSKWGMRQGRLLAPRCTKLFEKLQEGKGAEETLTDLFQNSIQEVYDVVRETIGYTEDEMDALAYEDLFTIAEAVIEVCLFDEGGGGALGKLMGLMGSAIGGLNTAAQAMNETAKAAEAAQKSASPPKRQTRH